MALYIDPPMWPAHGTHFSHLVSDASLGELHEFAAGLGIGKRAFDEDHYDVHVDLYSQAVAAGAIEVSGRDLIQALRSSGLRVPPQHRRDRVNRVLRVRWAQLEAAAAVVALAAVTANPVTQKLGEGLLTRWNERHRSYHGPGHLLDCLTKLDLLSGAISGRGPSVEVRLAAWFHDAVYDGVADQDEDASAELAQQALPGDLGAEVARLVRLTKDHRTTLGDLDGGLLIDADLAILSSEPEAYSRYVGQVRHEYSRATDWQWRRGRAAVLERLLARDRFYASDWAELRWREPAVRNLTSELRQLRGPNANENAPPTAVAE